MKPSQTNAGARAPLGCRIALLAGAICSVPAALAAPGDEGLDLMAGIGYFHDDNLFRLPDEHPGFGNRRSDSALQAHAGMLFNKTYGRQKTVVQAKATRGRFRPLRPARL
jgi:hypothetical protein